MSWNAANWYAQRITGGALLILLVAHFWVEHFASDQLLKGDLTYAAIRGRITTPLWQAIDVSFLFIALYHGLNGLRNIILDYSRVSAGAARVITALLIAAGMLWAWWGVEAFRNLS
jgi:succinate dehydrogenase hydrophobic anchor subunit